MHQETREVRSSRPLHRWSLLLVTLTAMWVIWCGVLPWVAAQPKMKQHLTFLDERGIDPSAMFYTELDAMDAILHKVDRTQSFTVAPTDHPEN